MDDITNAQRAIDVEIAAEENPALAPLLNAREVGAVVPNHQSITSRVAAWAKRNPDAGFPGVWLSQADALARRIADDLKAQGAEREAIRRYVTDRTWRAKALRRRVFSRKAEAAFDAALAGRAVPVEIGKMRSAAIGALRIHTDGLRRDDQCALADFLGKRGDRIVVIVAEQIAARLLGEDPLE